MIGITSILILIILFVNVVYGVKDRGTMNNTIKIHEKVSMEATMNIDWSAVDDVYDRIQTCFESSQTVYSWIGSMYMEFLVIDEMLKNTFFREHKRFKLKTLYVKLAYYLTRSLISPDRGTETNKQACLAEIIKYKNGVKDTFVDFGICYTTMFGDIKSYTPASRKTILTIVNMMLYQIDYDLDSIRRSQVVGKFALSLISSGISATTSFIFPKVGDLSIGGAGVANFGTSLINAAWDDVVDDEKFLYSIQTAVLLSLQKIVQNPGSKSSVMSKHKFGYSTLGQEVHFKILQLCLLISTGGNSFTETLVLFGGASKSDYKDIPKQVFDILNDKAANSDVFAIKTGDTVTKTDKCLNDDAKNSLILMVPETDSMTTQKTWFSDYPLITTAFGGNSARTEAQVNAFAISEDLKTIATGIINNKKMKKIVSNLKDCSTITTNYATCKNPLCFTSAQWAYTTSSLIEFIKSCTNEVRGVFSWMFGNTRLKYKLASSLIPKYDFSEPVLHVDYMDSPLLDSFG